MSQELQLSVVQTLAAIISTRMVTDEDGDDGHLTSKN